MPGPIPVTDRKNIRAGCFMVGGPPAAPAKPQPLSLEQLRTCREMLVEAQRHVAAYAREQRSRKYWAKVEDDARCGLL
jgi:hypothetical protein